MRADTLKRASGCLFGSAYGDALGADTEFISNPAQIIARFPPHGPRELQGSSSEPAQVTDDTQMMLAVGEALLEAEQPYTAESLEGPLRRAFVAWNISPENTRAPGLTCMSACKYLAQDMPWQEASRVSSKGCGANMRVAPVGLLHVTAEERAGIAQFQAALTHGHPTALAATDLTAFTIADLAAGGDPAGLPQRLREYAIIQLNVYHEQWLGPLWKYAYGRKPGEFISRGWAECLSILDRLDAALAVMDRESDPCIATGEGWIAEEAFATGLLCFLFYPDDPVSAIQRAAVTSGDSDSIACLAGAFAGAHLGLDAWPRRWHDIIEYRERLTRLGDEWDR